VDAGIAKIRLGVDSLTGEKSRPSSGEFPAMNVKQRIAEIRNAGVELELNIVVTKFNVTELPQIFQFCAQNKISAKIFEYVEVERFGTATASAEIHRKPIIEFPEFEAMLHKSGVVFQTAEANGFRGANYILTADGFSWRYCRYLCPFGLCYMTGTRIDPTGAVYVCMEKRFVEILSTGDSLAVSESKLRNVNERGCCRSNT
jgi:molybdenum cofactor biosynthesis enzyme MoaA